MGQNTLPPGITQEMIDEAKTKHGLTGMVKLITLVDGDGNDLMQVLMVRPTRTVIDMMNRFISSDPNKGYSVLLSGCLLSHKKEIMADTGVLITAAINGCLNMLPYSDPEILKLDENDLPEGITSAMVENAKKALAKDSRYVNLHIAKLQCDEEGNLLNVLMNSPARKAINDHEKYEDSLPKKAQETIIESAICSHEDEVKGNDWLWFAAYRAAIMLKPKGSAIIKNI